MFFIAGDMNQQGPLTLYVHGRHKNMFKKKSQNISQNLGKKHQHGTKF